MREREEEIEKAEELKKNEEKMSGDEAICSKEIEKAKKEIEKKEMGKANHGERSDEEYEKFARQTGHKVQVADKEMIHARYKIEVVKHQEERRVDKHSAKSQQIASLECSVPAPMNFGMITRGLNLAGTQVHRIGSRHGIRAVDPKEQAVEVIKAPTTNNRVLPKDHKHGNEDDAAESFASDEKNHGEKSSDETDVTQTEKPSKDKLSHIGATRGGIVATEIIKACSGKLVPNFQRLSSNAIKCLLEDHTFTKASKIGQRLFLAKTLKGEH